MKIRLFKTGVNRSVGGNIVLWLFMLLFSLTMVLPLVYAVSSALKPMNEFFVFPPKFFPMHPTLKNFSDLFSIFDQSEIPFTRYVINTVFVSVTGTAGQVVLASACAYALTKLRFPGRRVMLKMIVMSLMFNSTVTAIVNFVTLRMLGMVDTYWSIIIPGFASSLGLYLMSQFMDQMIPDSILEAARIDGSGEFRIFFTIAFPMVKPAWLTLIVFSFQALWNNTGSVYIYDERLKTVSFALSQIQAGGIARSGAAAAGAVLTMSVPILIFVLTQSSVMETMATSGMKD